MTWGPKDMRRQVYRKYSSDADPLDNPSDGFETTGAPLCPNKADIGSADSCASSGLTNAMEADMSRTELAAIWPPTASAARGRPRADAAARDDPYQVSLERSCRVSVFESRNRHSETNERRDPVLTNL